WMAWTEDPKDAQARELDKFKQQALSALQMASASFDRAERLSPFLMALGKGVDSILGFNFGAKGERVGSARDAAAGLVASGPRYFEPGSTVTIPDLPDLQIYVLGPPRDRDLLGLTEQIGDMYGVSDASGWSQALALVNSVSLQIDETSAQEDWWAPFDENLGT